jgi:methanogenic corrinoid protein MtbC1
MHDQQTKHFITGKPMPSIYVRTSRLVEDHRDTLAAAIVDRHWQQRPDLAARYDAAARRKCERDVAYTLNYLAHAVRTNQPALFYEYLAWLKVTFVRLSVPLEELAESLELTCAVLHEVLPPAEAALAGMLLAEGAGKLSHFPTSLPSFLPAAAPYAALAHRYLRYLLAGQRQLAGNLVLAAVAHGTPVRDIYLHVFQPCLHEIGRLWQTNEITVAQEHFCTAATQHIMSQLYPHIFAGPRRNRRLVAACVGQELHEIGLRMVADLFELEGWDTYYLGANTPPSGIVAAVTGQGADVLAISATMTFHLTAVQELIDLVRATPVAGSRAAGSPPLKILVGGYPFNTAPDLWRSVGADGSAADAAAAVALAERLVAGA